MKTLRDFFKGQGKNGNNKKLTLIRANMNEHNTWYQCPMKCEEDKLYDAPGNCPVCNMKLVPVDSKKLKYRSDGTENHSKVNQGHRHHGCC
ncbi:MAG TPA: heavy metal-binding domain-containing protein [Draconibacterium sp.]|nr:heavy metal-binding domain-containing protein [Draconibacterium sp.]